jgi:hypothetical protein
VSSVITQSYLEKNLACLGERNRDLVQAIRLAAPHSAIQFADTPQGVPAATLDGLQLSSRHRPLEEAQRQVDDIDLVEHAAVVVLGFGLGYHVRRLVERSAKATLIIVFEPDLAMLRSVLERVDHSSWLKDALVLFIADANDRGMLAKKLEGAESILAQGVHFFEHPPSRVRLREHTSQFTSLFGEFITAAKTTLMTTLMRSVDTTRNLLLNLDHYAAGPGIAELRGIAAGRAAVVVSAGPSLHKNLHLLNDAAVRDRCVIIAVQTTLKPLLNAGIRPHFVTALDYHEISKRFYEDLRAEDVCDVTLVADPKAHPVILDSFPGAIRCCVNPFLDKFLGPMKRDMGELPAGATVAHLAFYLAKFLGCAHIAMIGQDLGFTDGLYYAPHNPIHEVWAPEFNPFNSIEMMEWQRIVRHRLHLRKLKDAQGKSIYTDAQMHTYLQQFERDFAESRREGVSIIDATEGGVAKQHTSAQPLNEFLDRHVRGVAALPAIPLASVGLDHKRLSETRERMAQVRGEVRRLRELSRETAGLLRDMLADQHDLAKMARHFQKIDRNRKEVEKRFATFELLNALNQMGVFNRMKADRRIHMSKALNPLERQRRELERDLTNVTWIADAAAEMMEQLESCERALCRQNSSAANAASAENRRKSKADSRASSSAARGHAESRVAALIAIDPQKNGLGVSRSLSEPFNGRTALQATLERIGRSTKLETIILIVPRNFDVEALIDRARISLPIEIEHVDGSPFGPEHEAIAAARWWADTCWRGGIAGMSVYDEVLCPQIMLAIMQRRGLTAALVAGPDWPLIQVNEEGGCDAVVARHLEHPDQHQIVFTQSPPGLCGCLISAKLMEELSQRTRLSTIGALLVYQPHVPQGDPIARDVNVQIDHRVRQSLVRATFDTPRQRECLRRVQSPHSTPELISNLEAACGLASPPQHITLELTTDRTSRGLFRGQHRNMRRPQLTLDLARRIFDQLRQFNADDLILSLDGVGDPLLHPQLDQIVQLAKQAGIRGVHVRTELPGNHSILDQCLQSGVDVISVDLNADCAATYDRMMGLDGEHFKRALMNIEYLVHHRRKLTAHRGAAGFALPWIVPHIQRRLETHEDIDTFFDRWQHTLGCVVIEGPSRLDPPDSLAPAVTPPRVLDRDARRSLTILCDGAVPLHYLDWTGGNALGNTTSNTLKNLWNELQAHHNKS